MKEVINIVKIGGNIIDNDHDLQSFLMQFASISGNKILIHGGGKIATKLAEDLGHKPVLIDGRRVTDVDTLNLVIMTYAGLINKTIVARLQSFGCNALGLSGADGGLIRAAKRSPIPIDFGFVGDVSSVNASGISSLLHLGFCPVFSAITHDGCGLLLNTNADTIAQEVAKSLVNTYEVNLIYSFEKIGVLTDVNDDLSLIKILNRPDYKKYKDAGIISGGMIPKLDNAYHAIDHGVKKVAIGSALSLQDLLNGTTGTTIS